MLIPVYGFLEGDVLGLVVLVHDHQTMADFAASLLQATSMRVPSPKRVAVYCRGKRLGLHATVAQAGLTPLDRVDVVSEPESLLNEVSESASGEGEPVALAPMSGPLQPRLSASSLLESGSLKSGPLESGPLESGPLESGPLESGPLAGDLYV